MAGLSKNSETDPDSTNSSNASSPPKSERTREATAATSDGSDPPSPRNAKENPSTGNTMRTTDKSTSVSKTHFKRISYTLSQLPELYVVEVEVFTKEISPASSHTFSDKSGVNDDTQNETTGAEEVSVVSSSKLRLKALNELLKNDVSSAFHNKIAMKLNTKKRLLQDRKGEQRIVNHLIMPWTSNKDTEDAFPGEKFKGSRLLPNTKWEVPRTAQNRNNEEQDVYCRFLGEGKLSPGMDNYFECLDILITALTGSEERKNSHLSPVQLLRPMEQPLDDSRFKIAVRCQPKLERGSAKGESKLHLNFDLVPLMPHGRNVAYLLGQYFFSKGFAPGFQDQGIIKQMLCGLRVAYKKPGALDKNSKTVSSEGAVLFIRDLKPANEMGRIFVETKDGCKTAKSLSKSKQNMPYANIGGKRPFWVPLDDLWIDTNQILRHHGHLTQTLKALASSDSSIDYEVQRIANDTLEKTREVLRCVASKNDDERHTTVEEYTSKPLSASKIELYQDKDQILTIIHVAGDNDLCHKDYQRARDMNVTFLNKVKTRLEHPKQDTIGFLQIKTVRIASLHDSIREQVESNSELMEGVRNPTSTVLLGIIDSNGIAKARYREIEAELKGFGDRKLGAVTVCVEQQYLENLLNHPTGNSMFPAHITRKINLMLGRSIWESAGFKTEVKVFDARSTIVVGAHLSHPNPTANAFCPSVSAVVASLNHKMLNYPGSSRVQTRKSRGIVDLRSMMVERFRGWQEEDGNNKEVAPAVLFFRNGYFEGHQSVYDDEILEIEKAYREVFVPECKHLVYIGVSKNHKQQNDLLRKDNMKSTFTIVTETDKQTAARYQYHVLKKPTAYSDEDLAQLTADLNKTAQLGAINKNGELVPSGKALPLTYARKLALRVFDYVRFFPHKDNTNIPGISQQTPVNEPCEKRGESFKNDVEEYLVSEGVRSDGMKRPWKASLDKTMFYL